jgi:hypothetical protein
MTATLMASRLSDDLGKKIKPAQVNQALVELGLQVRPENGKRIWQLTEEGNTYGFSRLATSKTNDWSGPQVTWQESVIPLLIDYFESIEAEKLVGIEVEDASGTTPSDRPTPSDSTSPVLSESESTSWMVSSRIKALKKKVNSSQRVHIDMEAVEAYKQRHGKNPAKEQLKGKYYDIYPASDLDLVDEAIDRVLKRYAYS